MKAMSEASRQEKEEFLLANVLRETKHSNQFDSMDGGASVIIVCKTGKINWKKTEKADNSR